MKNTKQHASVTAMECKSPPQESQALTTETKTEERTTTCINPPWGCHPWGLHHATRRSGRDEARHPRRRGGSAGPPATSMGAGRLGRLLCLGHATMASHSQEEVCPAQRRPGWGDALEGVGQPHFALRELPVGLEEGCGHQAGAGPPADTSPTPIRNPPHTN